MIAALLLGRKGSIGFPGKNLFPVLGRPLALYPMLAACHSRFIDKVYLSTDCENLMRLAGEHGVEVIRRPAYLCTPSALGEEAFVHGYEEIKKRNPGKKIELMGLFFCNAPTFLPQHIDCGIEALRKNKKCDSAITVSKYNWYAPIRARRIAQDGLLQPFIPLKSYPKTIKMTCDRDSQGDVYFADVCVSIVRPSCLENLESGLPPQKWMGKKIYPIKNWGGLDVDEEFQIPQAEYWLRKNGFTKASTPYSARG